MRNIVTNSKPRNDSPRLQAGIRPASLSARDPLAYAAALKVLG